MGRARPDDDRGAVAVIVAAMLTVFIGLAALVVDRGLAADNQRQAQATADASALAAAVELSRSNDPAKAEQAARTYAAKNFGVTDPEWNACTAALQTGFTAAPGTSCISFNPGTKAVRVVLPPRKITSVFSGIFGVSSRTVASAATAGYAPALGANCVLCIMGTLTGQVGQIVAKGGDVYARDIDFNPSPNGRIDVTGGAIGFSRTWNQQGNFTPSPPQPTTEILDPYRDIPQPTLDTTKVAVAGKGACTPADYYYDISGCTSFAAGVYVLLGTDKHIANTSATNVMFFLTCSSDSGSKKAPVITAHPCAAGGEAGANFGGAGNTSVVLTSLVSDPVYKGFALWVDRNNTTGQTWTGGSDFTVNGTLYSPNPAGLDSNKGKGKITVVKGTAVLGSLQFDGNHVHLDVDGNAATATRGAVQSIPRLSQ